MKNDEGVEGYPHPPVRLHGVHFHHTDITVLRFTRLKLQPGCDI